LSLKSDLRSAALARRDALGADFRRDASLAAAAHAVPLLRRLRPGIVSGYWPIRSEADPRPLLGAARNIGISIALPVLLDGETLDFRAWQPGDALVPAGFGTLGPGAEAERAMPDLVILPLAAFDRAMHRIGYGKGHYDRAIAALAAAGAKPILLGLAFAAQEVEKVPFEPHDIPLDFIVTEQEWIAAREPGRAME